MSRLTILLAAACSWTNTVVLADGDPPVVHTQFSIEAPTFITGLGDERVNVESEIAAALAEVADRYYGFVRWSADADTAHELKVKLLAVPRAYGVAIFLEYAPSVGGTLKSLSNPSEELYQEFDEQPKERDEKDLLLDDVKDAISARFNDDSFRPEFEERFLSHIPLTTIVDTDETTHSILIPFSLEELRATDESLLIVRFKAHNQNNDLQDGRLELGAAGNLANRPGWLQCAVRHFLFLPQDESEWHFAIPTVLREPTSVLVYMDDYHPDNAPAQTSGPLADSLGDEQ